MIEIYIEDLIPGEWVRVVSD